MPCVATGFPAKYAVALSNFTIVGGALANLVFNINRRHPYKPRPLIDWDLTLVMEPATILGALIGGYFNKVDHMHSQCSSGRITLAVSTFGLIQKTQYTLSKRLTIGADIPLA